jgi:hypothetical protein
MISRHINCAPKNDNYRRLAQYIADASHKGEKCLMNWCAGCWSGDDEYQLAIKEVEDTQALNTRSAKEKTYHLIVSFRPEDEAKLTPEVFREIEMEFAKALGFEEHQRHAGVHKNTNNIHLHVAFNQIHREKLTRHEPFRDFRTRDKLCRLLERNFGLTPDNGRDPDKEPVANDAALAFEAHTGQESLFGYVQRHKSAILPLLAQAKSWAECHSTLIKYSLALKPHGNGLVLQDTTGKHSIKASDLDRSASKAKLEKRFGPFQAPSPDMLKPVEQAKKYNAIPLHKEPDRNGLYQRFQAGLKKRRAEMDTINQQEKRIYGFKCQEWDRRYKTILKMPMYSKDRQMVMAAFKDKKRRELASLRQTMKDQREQVKKIYPYSNWNQFLRGEAQRGNEMALAVLRSKKDKALPEHSQAPDQTKPVLLTVSKMVEINQKVGVKDMRYRIDGKGTVFFILPNGSTIRDNGKEIHFSAQDDQAKAIAEKLAQAKWGQNIQLDGDTVKSKSLAYTPIQRSTGKGMSR